MSNKQYGLRKEREVKKIMEDYGANFVTRQRGSFGFADVIAFFKDKCWLISVKATRKKTYNPKKEIKKLDNIKVPDYCKKELWVWADRKWERYYLG